MKARRRPRRAFAVRAPRPGTGTRGKTGVLLASARRRGAVVLGLATLALVAGCSKPKPRPPPSQEDLPPAIIAHGRKPPQPPAAGASAVHGTRDGAVPSPPAWAVPLMGKALDDTLPVSHGGCIGNTDVIDLRYAGVPSGVQVEGWGWDVEARSVVRHVVLTDEAGRIVGAADTGVPRPDVVAARKQVTSPTSGWRGVASMNTGRLFAYGVIGDGKTSCVLGHIDL